MGNLEFTPDEYSQGEYEAQLAQEEQDLLGNGQTAQWAYTIVLRDLIKTFNNDKCLTDKVVKYLQKQIIELQKYDPALAKKH